MTHRQTTGVVRRVGALTIFQLRLYPRTIAGTTAREIGIQMRNVFAKCPKNPFPMTHTQVRTSKLLLRLSLTRRTRKGLQMMSPTETHSNDDQEEKHAQTVTHPRTKKLRSHQQRLKTKDRKESHAHRSIVFDRAKTS
jgi:hypothetical protein